MTDLFTSSSEGAVPRVWLDWLKFSDGTEVNLCLNDIVVIVGPNNAGKSACLRGIKDFLGPGISNPVIAGWHSTKIGSSVNVISWLERFASMNNLHSTDTHYEAFGSGFSRSSIESWWTERSTSLLGLSRCFCHMLSADERLNGSIPAETIEFGKDAPHHPSHLLVTDDELESRISSQFRRAFGQDLIVNRLGGKKIPLHVGQMPKLREKEDRLSRRYVQELASLPRLEVQGDGMRSYASILLFTMLGFESIMLVDEPEAFLHPPQARMIGRALSELKQDDRQLFIATHSGDFMRGILDSNKTNLRVLRIRREGNTNVVKELDNERIQELWKDPLLRFSNILDGLFHEQVIACESDGDARFFSAVLDAIYEESSVPTRKPDVMFVHCGGKDRLPTVIKALRSVDVRVKIVADFDVLNNEQPLRRIVEACGGSWDDVRRDWDQVKSAIESKMLEINPEDIVYEIQKLLKEVEQKQFPQSTRKGIEALLKRTTRWSIAKTMGIAYVPPGDAHQAAQRLLRRLKELGLHVIPVGELEGFARSVGNHGPKWVNVALTKDLANDRELEDARSFVRELIG